MGGRAPCLHCTRPYYEHRPPVGSAGPAPFTSQSITANIDTQNIPPPTTQPSNPQPGPVANTVPPYNVGLRYLVPPPPSTQPSPTAGAVSPYGFGHSPGQPPPSLTQTPALSQTAHYSSGAFPMLAAPASSQTPHHLSSSLPSLPTLATPPQIAYHALPSLPSLPAPGSAGSSSTPQGVSYLADHWNGPEGEPEEGPPNNRRQAALNRRDRHTQTTSRGRSGRRGQSTSRGPGHPSHPTAVSHTPFSQSAMPAPLMVAPSLPISNASATTSASSITSSSGSTSTGAVARMDARNKNFKDMFFQFIILAEKVRGGCIVIVIDVN